MEGADEYVPVEEVGVGVVVLPVVNRPVPEVVVVVLPVANRPVPEVVVVVLPVANNPVPELLLGGGVVVVGLVVVGVED